MTFKFLNRNKKFPKRVVILGSTGIISTNLQRILKKKNIKFISVGRSKFDLKSKKTIKKLRKKIKKRDSIIFIAAEAHVKNSEMFLNNIKICETVCGSLEKKKIDQLIYISSDAVYADIKGKITEKTVTSPNSFHGLMHMTRELMLKNKFKKLLCILRPTLIYGLGDTHNGYGPNRFVGLATKNKPMLIFGNGEERRDHIFVDDLVKIIAKCLEKKALGILNLVSGKVYSFKYLAKLIIAETKSNSKLIKIKRKGPMPHNGYRPFNKNLLQQSLYTLSQFNKRFIVYCEFAYYQKNIWILSVITLFIPGIQKENTNNL